MTKPFEAITNLNRLIHEPARLAILTALSACESADFIFLRQLTGLTAVNLSSHVNKLEEGGLVQVEKQFINNRPNTLVQITQEGQTAIKKHWDQLQSIRNDADQWSPEE